MKILRRRGVRVFVLGIAALFAGLIPAHGQAADPPSREVLANGLTFILQKDAASSVTVLEILIKGGKQSEPAGLEGLAYLTTRLALEIPDQSKAQELMEKSSQWATTAKGDYSLIHIECLTEYLEDTLAVFMKILNDPLLSGIRIDRAKDFMANQRKIESDDNLNTAHLEQARLWLKDSGYAGSVYGEDPTLKAIKGRDVETYFKNTISADNMVVVAVSDLEPGKLGPILKKKFGSFPANSKAQRLTRAAPISPAPTEREVILDKDTKQACVSAGFGLPPLSARTHALVRILENLLGKGPGSRLWPLRSELKLAYSVSAVATLMKTGGILEAYLETDAAKTGSARDALAKCLGGLFEKGIGAEELAEAKAMVKSDFLRLNETKFRRADTLSFFEIEGLGVEEFKKFPQTVEAVTLEDLNVFIREVLDPAKATTVIVGPKTSR